jgi:hypothetical protein
VRRTKARRKALGAGEGRDTERKKEPKGECEIIALVVFSLFSQHRQTEHKRKSTKEGGIWVWSVEIARFEEKEINEELGPKDFVRADKLEGFDRGRLAR